MEESDSSPLSPAILRGLGDRSYDKRKAASVEVTNVIKSILDNGKEKDRENQIYTVINFLAKGFAESKSIHQRKGGLIGLAACAIGLTNDIDPYLDHLIPPVIACFGDQESRICYYACEALYNICKVARAGALRYFNQIFDGLCNLFSHGDQEVRNGANLLDRLIKDIVTESEKFEIESFIPLLQKHIRKPKPYIRQLIVSWISVLHNVPDINMLDYLPEILEGLFNMISDSNREIEQAAANALGQFLRDIKETAEVIEFAPIVTILIQEARQPNRDIRYTAMVWISEFITLGSTKLVSLYSGMLSSVMYNISDSDSNIRDKTVSVSLKLTELMRATTEAFNLSPILLTLTAELSSEHVESRKAALDWIRMLHDKDPKELNKHIIELLPALLKAISDEDGDVVSAALELKAKIARDKTQFNTVLEALINLFYENRPLLELKGALVIRKLSSMLEPQEIYISLATILNDHPDYDFVSLMVQTLNLILLTAPELNPLRRSLKTSGSAASSAVHKDVFESLFRCWCHNPVSTFSLCLLAQAYDLSSKLISKFAEVEITIGFLMQIDKLVQLLESPIFTQLRLQLLEVNSEHHADLVKSLYGLLMLLPQSQAYKTLSDRLSTASSLHMHIGFAHTYAQAVPVGTVLAPAGNGSGFLSKNTTPASPKKDNGKQNQFGKDSLLIDYDKLLKHFDTAQSRHYSFRQLVLREKNFVGESNKAQLSTMLVNGTTL